MNSVFKYFIDVFKKDGPHKSKSSFTRMMHGINKLSILIFIVALIVLFVKWFS